MKAIHKTLVIETTTNVNERSLTITELRDNNIESDDDSDDDNLFENLRKICDANLSTTNKNNIVPKTSKNKRETKINRKRSISVEPEEPQKRKIQRIEEDNETSEEEDILSFTKKTLEHDLEDVNTEDILSHLRQKTNCKF